MKTYTFEEIAALLVRAGLVGRYPNHGTDRYEVAMREGESVNEEIAEVVRLLNNPQDYSG